MSEHAVIGIALLFGISLAVRILPALAPFNFSETTRRRIKSHLPVAVFVNLLVYCVHQEIALDPYPALIGLAALFVLFKPFGLLSSIAVGTILYVSLGHYL